MQRSASTMQKNTDWLILNGNLHADLSSDFFQKNRAFRLGDGFFETVRVIDGSVSLMARTLRQNQGLCKSAEFGNPRDILRKIST